MSAELRRLGKYELLQRLAQGGMGEVWKAFDPQLRRDVAIKVLHASLQNAPDFAERFQREAQFIASLRHPNIVQIHDFGFAPQLESETTIGYMVMDYVEGPTLANYIRNTSRKAQFPPPDELVSIFTAISLAIDYAHQRGMVHRDLKPTNIILDQRHKRPGTPGEPILIDFGIARLQNAPASTAVGMILGTPLYISPEQAQGKSNDKRSDLYSLGIILYELMTGVTPFRGETTLSILKQHVHDAPTPPALINPSMPPALSTMILKSIAKNPTERFESASAMAVALAEAFEVPVPPSLRQLSSSTGSVSEPHPLQPPPSAFASFTASPSLPATNLTQITSSDSPNTDISIQAAAKEQRPTYPSSVGPSFEESPHTPSTERKPSRHMYIIIAAVLIVIMATAGWFVFSPLAQGSQQTVGHVTFSGASGSSFGTLQIDITNLPSPPASQTYYAWLESSNSDSDGKTDPHWSLASYYASNAIHTSLLSDKSYANLRLPNSFLIINEDRITPAPLVRLTGLYYARITQSATTFDILRCSSDAPATICSS